MGTTRAPCPAAHRREGRAACGRVARRRTTLERLLLGDYPVAAGGQRPIDGGQAKGPPEDERALGRSQGHGQNRSAAEAGTSRAPTLRRRGPGRLPPRRGVLGESVLCDECRGARPLLTGGACGPTP